MIGHWVFHCKSLVLLYHPSILSSTPYCTTYILTTTYLFMSPSYDPLLTTNSSRQRMAVTNPNAGPNAGGGKMGVASSGPGGESLASALQVSRMVMIIS